MAAREPDMTRHGAMSSDLAGCVRLRAPSTVPARADGLEAGLWLSVQTPTLNGIAGPPRESKRCLRDADVSDLNERSVPSTAPPTPHASRWSDEFTPQRLKWRLQCRGQLDMDVAGEFVFERPDRYTATIVAVSSMLGKTDAGSGHPDRGRARRSV